MVNNYTLLIGSNMGNKQALIQDACLQLALLLGKVKAQSSLYQTEAWGNTEQESFLNQAIVVESHYDPHEALLVCQTVEQDLGRQRLEKWGSRTMDIDIILCDDLQCYTSILSIPHPLMHLRRFVLVPLAEIIPDVIHPVFKETILELLNKCEDILNVAKI
jgi:2-amino-4-hydroxy-6-hydroxymethyldihydropteridine diphosphokinase